MSQDAEAREVYRRALAEIVQVLGPDAVCDCPNDCGLRAEAADALLVARTALASGGIAHEDATHDVRVIGEARPDLFLPTTTERILPRTEETT